MSRGEFRAAVEAPRPASAWMLVSVASATLWITQQLDAWLLVLQPLLLVATLARRTRPIAWQRSPIALNVGMFGIVGVVIEVALRGGPSTIALAHFASLTQALQLFDARPRRTEFLLVALALFQVILAANLTDSPFFPPLLVAFLFAVVWTLLVHTLRSEAIEAGDARPLTRTITPGLLRMTSVACAVSLVLAMVLFVALPRLRSSVVHGPALGASVATAGFSDQVQLGELGRIRQDPTVVMRVETVEGEAPERTDAYWRGLAFDHFDGRSWSITPPEKTLVPGSPEGGITMGNPENANLVQRIVREPVEAGVLFGLGELRRVQGTILRVQRDRNGGLYAIGQDDARLRYEVSSHDLRYGDRALRRDRAVPPPDAGERYLQLPEGSEPIAELAREIAGGLDTAADRVRALERYLLENGRYSDMPPPVEDGDGPPPVHRFLFGGLSGHCEYFASALVLMSRSLGVPARLVNGFAGGRRNRIGGFVELTRSDAHAWVEVSYARAGWVRYDATPPDLRTRAELALSWGERFREFGSALELYWYQRVVGFDRSDQVQALKRAYFAWKGWDDKRGAGSQRRDARLFGFAPGAAGRPVALAAVGLAAAAGLLWALRRARPRRDLPPYYAEALRLLARRGLERPPQATARAFAREVEASLPEAPARAFGELTDAYLCERFGGRRPAEAPAGLRALREGLRRGAA